MAAQYGQIILSTALIDGKKQLTAYVPVDVGSGARSVFSVTLTESSVVGRSDELIADHVMVIAALSLLVLGLAIRSLVQFPGGSYVCVTAQSRSATVTCL